VNSSTPVPSNTNSASSAAKDRRPMDEQLSLFPDAPFAGEILSPPEAAQAGAKAAGKRLRGVVRATFQQISINRYVAVFGAVPNHAPRRQWLSDGSDTYHIADIWKDPDVRERVLARLRSGPMSWKKLALYLELDLVYLDEFARRGSAAVHPSDCHKLPLEERLARQRNLGSGRGQRARARENLGAS
jgi:hypothetical protein